MIFSKIVTLYAMVIICTVEALFYCVIFITDISSETSFVGTCFGYFPLKIFTSHIVKRDFIIMKHLNRSNQSRQNNELKRRILNNFLTRHPE